MLTDRWREIETLYHSACERKPEERRAYLESACGGDESLRLEVESLLAHEELAANFLETHESTTPGNAVEASVPAGEQIGPYLVLEFLQKGGMGEVYKARDKRLDRPVAIKFLPRALAADPTAVERFQREVRAASSLNHPRICTVHDVGEFQGRPFLVMEFLEGQSLRDRIAGGPLPIAELMDLAVQICDALKAAHAKDIVHRDIKPGNIFITAGGQIKILDFGLAKRSGEARALAEATVSAPDEQTAATATRITITRPGSIAGTLAYLSPEQARSEEVDIRTDIYSMGVVLYQMATGRPTFRAETSEELIGAILYQTPIKPSVLNPPVPASLERIILKALEKAPTARYQSVADLLADLENINHDPGIFDSIAVLPLVNETADPETEYLSDGISESIINLLSRFHNLRVIPRTSAFRYKGRKADLKKVGRDLKVRTVLTGKLIQRGDRLVVQTELVDVANDAQLWGGQFNRKLEDIFEVQEELAHQISEKLRLRLTSEDEKRLTKRSTQNREAYQFLLKAQYHTNKMTPEGYQRGMEYARQAIEEDPGYADAYVQMAAVYSGLGALGFLRPTEAFPKAKAAVLKALEINDSLAEAHAFLAAVRLFYDWDWSGAEHACKRAIELNPNYAKAHALLGDCLLITGRHEEAMAEDQLAVALDPLSASLNVRFGEKLLWSGDHERAIEQLKKALEFDANFAWTHLGLAQAYAWRGMYAESLASCEKVTTVFGGNPHSRALRSLILAMAGKTEEAKTILNELNERPKLDPMALICSAESWSVLGEKDKAFQFLEAAYQDRVSLLIYLDVRPTFNNIRSDPRFADLRRRIGLPGAMNNP